MTVPIAITEMSTNEVAAAEDQTPAAAVSTEGSGDAASTT
jgi:hypothetical protein